MLTQAYSDINWGLTRGDNISYILGNIKLKSIFINQFREGSRIIFKDIKIGEMSIFQYVYLIFLEMQSVKEIQNYQL